MCHGSLCCISRRERIVAHRQVGKYHVDATTTSVPVNVNMPWGSESHGARAASIRIPVIRRRARYFIPSRPALRHGLAAISASQRKHTRRTAQVRAPVPHNVLARSLAASRDHQPHHRTAHAKHSLQPPCKPHVAGTTPHIALSLPSALTC